MAETSKKKKAPKKSTSNQWILVGIVVIAVAVLVLAVAWASVNREPTTTAPRRASSTTNAVDNRRPAPVLPGKIFGVGTWWEYETLDATLTIKITGKKKVGSHNTYVYEIYYGDDKIATEYRIHDDKILAIAKSDQGDGTTVTVFNPPIIRVMFPLKVGDRWVNRYTVDGIPYVSECSVESYEKIKTKGGVFLCYKIKHETYFHGDKKNATIDADWYAPGIGLVSYARKDGENPKALLRYHLVEEKK